MASWLRGRGLGDVAEALLREKVDGSVLRSVTQDDLKELGIALGDRKRLMLLLAEEKEKGSLEAAAAPPSSSSSATASAPAVVAALPPPPSGPPSSTGGSSPPSLLSLPVIASSAPELQARSSILPNLAAEAEFTARTGRAPKRLIAHRAPVKVTKRTKMSKYQLLDHELTPSLQAEMAQFKRFLTVKFLGQQEARVREATAEKYLRVIRGVLGYLTSYGGMDLASLKLRDVFPTNDRKSVQAVFEFLQWSVEDRKINPRTEAVYTRSLIQLAKFLFRDESKADPTDGDKPYHDIVVVRELRKIFNDARMRSKNAPLVAQEDLKLLAWPDFLAAVDRLRLECAEKTPDGKARPLRAIAWSYQTYLICAILSCIPDRQRTLRELEVGRTLFKKEDGSWAIQHGPGDYKTGAQYGERPELVIAEHIIPYLEAFLSKWRPHLAPKHNRVFTKKNGEEPTEDHIHAQFTTAMFRLTGKKANPHSIRDSIVTYARSTNASERDLEALAIMMGHSPAMQRETYDRRTKSQKVAPAVTLMKELSKRTTGQN